MKEDMSSTNLWVLAGLGLAGFLILSRRQRKQVKQGHGAFVQYFELLPPPPPAPPKAPHPLTGLTFAVKDIFNVEGLVTGFGNPDWARTHEVANQTAPAVLVLVQGGATCIGKTHMDELAYSINGENKHYGTPTNPAAPTRIPGGSSSGSAVAVAAELVNFALGTDTGGSVRVPAAFCGILGFRPSHGIVPTVGVIPMAQSFDTVGWFARDPSVLHKVGHVLLQLPPCEPRQPRRVLIAGDCFQLSTTPQERTMGVVIRSIEKLLGRQVLNHINLGQYIASRVPSLKAFIEKEEMEKKDMGVLALTGISRALRLIQR
ncbi:hypothetical protein O6H91_18G026100 [Diphasiastrum complanatum]|nr:hypothetical protein O6H91_18G026100 [Diphasiastrum complanatum]